MRTTPKFRRAACPKCRRFSEVHRVTLTTVMYKCGGCGHRFIKQIHTAAHEEEDNAPSFFIWNHQNKADALIRALIPKYEQSDSYLRCGMKFLLSDSDIRGRANQMKVARKNGCKAFFVYSHAAPPSLINAHFPGWEHTSAQFVVNEYHAEVLRQAGYTKPLESTGWYLSEVKPFTPRPKIKNVLFAPIHPRNAPIDREVNAGAFERLYKLAKGGAFHLSVRFIGDLSENGLERKAGVNYIQGRQEQKAMELDSADVVVAHQTFAWKSVALGIPTVMMKEDMPRHYKTPRTDWDFIDSKIWNRVVGLFRFPYDIFETGDTMTLLQQAAKSDCGIADWKKRMIGDAFDPSLFLRNVEKYL